MNELATKYDPSEVEDKWYHYWMAPDMFKSVPDEREPYTEAYGLGRDHSQK